MADDDGGDGGDAGFEDAPETLTTALAVPRALAGDRGPGRKRAPGPDGGAAPEGPRPLRMRREPANAKDGNAIALDDAGGTCMGYVPRAVASVLAPLADDGVVSLSTSPAVVQADDRLTLTLKPAETYMSPMKTKFRQGVTEARSAAAAEAARTPTRAMRSVHATRLRDISGIAQALAAGRSGSVLSHGERRVLQEVAEMSDAEAALVARLCGRKGAQLWTGAPYKAQQRRRPFVRVSGMQYDDVADVANAAQAATRRGWLAYIANDGDVLDAFRNACDADDGGGDGDCAEVSDAEFATMSCICELVSVLNANELSTGLEAAGAANAPAASAPAAALRAAAYRLLSAATTSPAAAPAAAAPASAFLASVLDAAGPLVRLRGKAAVALRRARLLFFHGDMSRELDDTHAIRGQGRSAYPRYAVEPRGGLAPPLFADREGLLEYERAWHAREAAEAAWEMAEGARGTFVAADDDDPAAEGDGGDGGAVTASANNKGALYEHVVAATETSYAWLLADASYPPWLEDTSALPPPPSPPRTSDAALSPPPLLSAGKPHAEACHRRTCALQRLRRFEEERQLLWLLLSRRHLPRRRGQWHERYATILCTHTRPVRRTLALEAIERARDDHATSPAFRFALERRALRLARQLKLFANGWRLGGVPASAWRATVTRLDWKPEETTLSVARSGNAAGPASPSNRADWHAGAAGAVVGRVEVAALRHLERAYGEGWRGVHSEGGFWRTVFGLLMWDVIYAPGVSGAFVHKHQYFPADYHTGFAFAWARRSRMCARIRDVLRGRAPELVSAAWREHAGENGGGLAWTCTDSGGDVALDAASEAAARTAALAATGASPSTPALVQAPRALRAGAVGGGSAEQRWLCGGWSCAAVLEVLSCIPRRVLASVLCLGVLGDAKWASGAPDLLLWSAGECRMRAVEVKGPGDTLRVNQVHWLSVLAGHTDLAGDLLRRLGGTEADDQVVGGERRDVAIGEAVVARVVASGS